MKLIKFSLTALLFSSVLLSCDKGTDVVETIAADPSSITAESELASYDIQLTSNAAWTAVLEGIDGVDPSWLSLSKSKGTGDAKVSVRVLQNKYSSVRAAKVVFTTEAGKTATVSVNQKENSSGSEMSSVKVRLGSYNLRMSNLDTDDANKWSVRQDRLKVSIEENDFDVAGLQEVSTATQSWLTSKFGATYDFFFFSPYSQGGSGDKAQGIMFKKNLFSISDKHFFWASDTPETCRQNDTGDSGNFTRGGHCAVFTHKSTGIKFFFMNTHGCLNKDPNVANAHVYVDMEKKYNTDKLPSFFVGDLNARPDLESVATYKAHWNDSYEKCTVKSKCAASYNGYKSPNGSSRIDYVFFRNCGSVVDEFRINNTLYDNLYASDHFPVYANVTINK